MKILFVCTANRCRSPMAAVLFHASMSRHGLDDVEVISAGRMMSGVPASDGAVRAMARRSIDLQPHRSLKLERELARSADLVVCMAREHVRDVVVLAPDLLPRTFTLKELVRRGEAHRPRGAEEPLATWLDVIGRGREAKELLGQDPADDVSDPIGQSDAVYERTVVELTGLTERLARLLVPSG